VQNVAELLRRLHALEVPTSVQTVNLLSVLEGYWMTLDAHQSFCEVGVRAQARAYALESTQVSERCLCHHDVHHLNLMSDGRRLWLLDWEYAGIGDPLFDLASVCCYHEYDERLREQLLQSYRGSVVQSELQRLERMCWLFNYIKTLWIQVREFQKHQVGLLNDRSVIPVITF
jgi:thiamine kinase-like enzyme